MTVNVSTLAQVVDATESSYPPGFMVLHGNRLEDLRDLLVQFVKAQPLPVLTPEVILVQSNGMKHWLEMSLADPTALGICAATQMELPSGYLWQIYRKILGAAAVPLHMPFDKKGLIWRLVRLLPELVASNPVYAPLNRYLNGQPNARKLYQLASQVADVLDGYQSYRADWLSDWAQGELGGDVLRAHDGTPVLLDAAHAWQAQLWRDLRADVGECLRDSSRASIHAQFLTALTQYSSDALESGGRPRGLPWRVVVFGISSLPMQTVQALAALGRFCQVLLLVQNPCQYYWGDIVEGHAQLRQQVRRRQVPKPTAPMEDDALHTATHPLLASWGKQGRDYLHLLAEYDDSDGASASPTRVDVFVDPLDDQRGASQLNELQSAIFNLQALPDAPAPRLPDGSLVLVTAHSAQREVEVLHDRLLSWFDANPSLNPRDVMVMVPDMATFAPHVQAVFGRFSVGQARHIPYALADITPRQSPLVQALEQLLTLPVARVSLADWLALFEVAAVRQRFGLSESDVVQLQDWLTLAGVRWGLDATHRQRWGMSSEVAGADQNTWAFGLRRLLLGYAVGAGEPWQNTLPQAALGGLDAALAGALVDWVNAIELTLDELSQAHPPEQWGTVLTGVVARFFAASDDAQERLLQRCLTPLQAWLDECAQAGLTTPLPLEVVREHWLAQIDEGGLHQRFFGGGVQFGSLMPMRSIPFKVICLLGMNDGDYPRQQAARDFDLMAQSWRPGDRSRREDDRYLFLEAVLCARQKLYISWQGHRATDNTEQPPSVLVAQLMDYLACAWTPAITPQQQPLQPFSQAYFVQDSAFQTYDDDWARVHEAPASTAPTPTDAPELTATPVPQVLTLADLRQLLRQPVEVFFKARLGVRFDSVEELEQEEEPFSLNGLAQYQVGMALLEAGNAASALDSLRLCGQLPLAAFGTRLAAQLRQKTQLVVERQTPWSLRYPQTMPAQSIDLVADGMAITGTLDSLWQGQDGCLQRQQRVGAVLEGDKAALRARVHVVTGLWVNHLALCAGGLRATSVQLGLDGEVVFAPLAPAHALALLGELVQAYRLAWARPLPVACKTAWAYLQVQIEADRLVQEGSDKSPKDPHDAAQAVFEGGHQRPGEHPESPYLSRAFERYDDMAHELPTWANQLYAGLAAHAQVNPHH